MATQEVRILDATQAQVTAELALGAANFWDEAYEVGGQTREGPTCDLWLTLGHSPPRHIRVHAGQRIDTPRGRIEVLELGQEGDRSCVRIQVVAP